MESGADIQKTFEKNPYFEVMAYGQFNPDQVKVENGNAPIISEALQELIDKDWNARNAKRQQLKQLVLESESKFIFCESPHIEDGKLKLAVALSDFKNFLATRSDQIRRKFPELVADIIGTNIILKTSDNKILVVQRSLEAATKPGALSVVGGYADPETDVDSQGIWAPFKTVTRELQEETGVSAGEVSNMAILGIIDNLASNNPSVIFLAETKLSSSDVKKRKGEEVIVKFIADDQKEIEKAIFWWAFSPSPTGSAALALLGRQEFGEQWFNFVNQRIVQRHQRLYSKLSAEGGKKLESRSANRLSRMD